MPLFWKEGEGKAVSFPYCTEEEMENKPKAHINKNRTRTKLKKLKRWKPKSLIGTWCKFKPLETVIHSFYKMTVWNLNSFEVHLKYHPSQFFSCKHLELKNSRIAE